MGGEDAGFTAEEGVVSVGFLKRGWGLGKVGNGIVWVREMGVLLWWSGYGWAFKALLEAHGMCECSEHVYKTIVAN